MSKKRILIKEIRCCGECPNNMPCDADNKWYCPKTDKQIILTSTEMFFRVREGCPLKTKDEIEKL